MICPGGGHRVLAIDHEGYDVASWLASKGVAGFVLKYRLANEEGSSYKVDVHALADARRAVRLVRGHAQGMGRRPGRVGLMGFSAGGELAILAGTKFEAGQPDASDPIDRLSSRPDFLMLIYPGIPRVGSSESPRRRHPRFWPSPMTTNGAPPFASRFIKRSSRPASRASCTFMRAADTASA